MEIRPAQPSDLPELARLIQAHAAYEQAPPPQDGLDGLAAALWGPKPRAWCLVASANEQLVGYASYSLEFSTWAGAEYLHLDCLYLDGAARGAGLGARLLERVAAAARDLGAAEIQWQTPAWNTDAIRFYQREGAAGRPKTRFSLRPGPPR